jgi:hypothetical protein
MKTWNVGELILRKRDFCWGEIKSFDGTEYGVQGLPGNPLWKFSPEEMEEYFIKPTEEKVQEEKERRKSFLEKLYRDEQKRKEEEEQKRLQETSVKLPKLTPVQVADRDDPSILGLIWEKYSKGGRLLLSCQGSRVNHLAKQLSQSTALSETEALDYISPASEKTHDAKFYIMLPATTNEDFHVRVSNFFGSRTIKASTREDQYNSKSLSVWLMEEHGVLPEKRS